MDPLVPIFWRRVVVGELAKESAVEGEDVLVLAGALYLSAAEPLRIARGGLGEALLLPLEHDCAERPGGEIFGQESYSS